MTFDPVTERLLSRITLLNETERHPGFKELLDAVIVGLAATSTLQCLTNQEIRESVHRELRSWASHSLHADEFRFRHFSPALRDGQIGCFSRMERGESDLLLLVSPVGIVHRNDPGRAFHLAAEIVATIDADPRTFLCAGAIGSISALLSAGASAKVALSDTARFIRPFDWSGDLPHVLSGGGGRRRESAIGCSPQEALATAANALLNIGCDDDAEAGITSADDQLSAQLVALAPTNASHSA